MRPGDLYSFSIECICTPELQFITFEISARIVAGTNLYPQGSPYTWYTWDETMSTGRRIARELKHAINSNKLEDVTS